MKAVQFAEYGDPSVLDVRDVEAPRPGPGQIRIAVHAAGVNPLDWKIRAGEMREWMPLDFPSGTGSDAAGIVVATGDDIGEVDIGDAVFGYGPSTYAEQAVLDVWAPKPAALAFEEAAGSLLPVETALRAVSMVGLTEGETVLISGAAGGVGSAAVQIARSVGASVIGTAGPDHQEYLRALGATPTTYGAGLGARVRDLAPDGVDAAIDVAGSGIIPELIDLTGDASRVLSVADYSAGRHGAQIAGPPGDRQAALAETIRLVDAGKLKLTIARSFGLDQAREAHEFSEQGHVAGRTVIVP